MEFPHFVRVEQETKDGKSHHIVVHTEDPKMVIELMPDPQAADEFGQGIIKRVAVPNSWAGNYSQYAKVIAKAQAFFKASRSQPIAAKAETRRFAS